MHSDILEVMIRHEPLPRSPELMSTGDCALLVVDVQEKVIRLVPGYRSLVWNIARLVDGAQALGVPVAATEHYPQGLGGTVPELAARLGAMPTKLTFSCGGCPQIFQDWERHQIQKVLVAGIETHVCVQQTTLDLLTAGFQIYLAVDAIGARKDIDHQVALRRMEAHGATLTTTEAALFEWCQTAERPEFKKISALVKQQGPEGNDE
jgi:nicotinamidase-related amidase